MKISVIIPAYNAEAFLRDALRSVFRNACAPLEVVVVDDGSTDGTPDVAREFAVEVLRVPHAGVAAARNAGLGRVSGELLTWLDADDRWPDGRLERQLRVLVADASVDVVYGRVQQFVSEGGREVPLGTPALARLPGSMLIWRDRFARVGGFDESLHVGEFMDWLVRSRPHQLRELMLEEVCLERRIHTQNLGVMARDRRGDYLRVARRSLKSRPGTP